MELRLQMVVCYQCCCYWPFTLQHVLIEWSVIPFVFGAVGALWLNMLLWAGIGFGGVVLLLRVLAKRQPAWFFVELALIALGTAVVFFPHQYKIIMRPLWLSDLAWSIGLEPSVHWGLSALLWLRYSVC